MSKALIITVGGLFFGMFIIVKNQTNSLLVLTTGIFMIISYLLFMATLPKETNIISYFMN